MSNTSRNFIKIDAGKMHCSWELYHKIEDNGMHSWYIPAFKLFYSTATAEQGEKRGMNMTKSFFDFYLKKGSFKEFILEIHKLGFKSDRHNLVMRDLLNHKIDKANFKSPAIVVRTDFKKAANIQRQLEVA